MKILIACEYSAVVRDAFRARGHDAWSCDTEPTEGDPRWHHHGPVEQILHNNPWDMLIGFPPCTHLSCIGAPAWAAKRADGRQQRAVDFFMMLANAPIERVAIENPIGFMSSAWRKPDQIIEPWMFGDPWKKKTCLWLKDLPKLRPTNVVEPQGRWVAAQRADTKNRYGKAPSGYTKAEVEARGEAWGAKTAKERSRTFAGIANAMASQWG